MLYFKRVNSYINSHKDNASGILIYQVYCDNKSNEVVL